MDPTQMPGQKPAPHAIDFIEVAGCRLEYYWTRPPASAETVLIFLHEGLGSAALWRDFPAAVAAATGFPALVYSRYGYGGSDVFSEPRGVDYMHHEALQALPLRDSCHSLKTPTSISSAEPGSSCGWYSSAPNPRTPI